MSWFSAQAADFFKSGIERLISRYSKCLERNGDHVEKANHVCIAFFKNKNDSASLLLFRITKLPLLSKCPKNFMLRN